jgi:hypothetical protein
MQFVPAAVVARGTRCLCHSCTWDLLFMQVAGFARQAPPQGRPRYFWANSETKVRLCCHHLNSLGRRRPDSFAPLALTRVPLFAQLGLELSILGEKPQALEGGDSNASLDPPSTKSPSTQTPGPAPVLRDIVPVQVCETANCR